MDEATTQTPAMRGSFGTLGATLDSRKIPQEIYDRIARYVDQQSRNELLQVSRKIYRAFAPYHFQEVSFRGCQADLSASLDRFVRAAAPANRLRTLTHIPFVEYIKVAKIELLPPPSRPRGTPDEESPDPHSIPWNLGAPWMRASHWPVPARFHPDRKLPGRILDAISAIPEVQMVDLSLTHINDFQYDEMDRLLSATAAFRRVRHLRISGVVGLGKGQSLDMCRLLVPHIDRLESLDHAWDFDAAVIDEVAEIHPGLERLVARTCFQPAASAFGGFDRVSWIAEAFERLEWLVLIEDPQWFYQDRMLEDLGCLDAIFHLIEELQDMPRLVRLALTLPRHSQLQEDEEMMDFFDVINCTSSARDSSPDTGSDSDAGAESNSDSERDSVTSGPPRSSSYYQLVMSILGLLSDNLPRLERIALLGSWPEYFEYERGHGDKPSTCGVGHCDLRPRGSWPVGLRE